MLRTCVLSALVLAVGLLTRPADAGQVTIEYDITSGSVNAAALFTSVGLTDGALTLRYTASSPTAKSTGPASLYAFTASGFGGNYYSDALVQETFYVALSAPVAGTGTTGSGFGNSSPAYFGGTVTRHCTEIQAGACSAYGANNPASASYFYFFGATASPGGLAFAASTTSANGTATGLYFTVGGTFAGAGTLTFTGSEVSRTFVPEPGSSVLLGTSGAAALALLAGHGLLRRRRET